MNDAEKIQTTSLVVDQNNLILQLGEDWEQEAEKSGSSDSLRPNRIIGMPLSYFIEGDSTVMYIEASLSLCRVRQQTLFREYRCDSPTNKRFMELQLTPLENYAVRMTHFLLREELLDIEVDLEKLQTPVAGKHVSEERRHTNILRCSMCNQLRFADSNEWLEPDVFFIHNPEARGCNIIHTVCPACKETIWKVRH